MKRTIGALLRGILIIMVLSSCQTKSELGSATKYFAVAFDSIEKYSLHRNTLNIDSIEQYYAKELNDTMPLKYAHHYLEYAINSIDRHSDLIRPGEFKEKIQTPPDLFSFRGRLISDTYAYIEIRACNALDSTSSKAYADSLLALTNALYRLKPSGWIIDLRSNTGGNLYPMLAGLSPLLGEGVLGYHLYPDGVKEPWYVFMNVNNADESSSQLLDSLHQFPAKERIVVLIGAGTGSAGEGLLLSFMGDERVKVIGEPTFGVATGNRMVFLQDSAVLNITDSYMTDRNGNYSTGKLEPDVLTGEAVQTYDLAYKWINFDWN